VRICDLHTGVICLSRAAKDLREQWNATADCWQDQNRRDFEEQHLQPLAPRITLMIAAVQRLNEVLEAAERELTDQEREAS